MELRFNKAVLFPWCALIAADLTKLRLRKDQHDGDPIPVLTIPNSERITGDFAIGRYIAWNAEESNLLTSENQFLVHQWMDFSLQYLQPCSPQRMWALGVLNGHLQLRSFFVGYDLTLADVAVWGALKVLPEWNESASAKLPMLARWYAHLENSGSFRAVSAIARARRPPPKTAKSTAKGAAVAGKKKASGSFDINLPGASEGNVVTRFPPEPSGYMHIGHVKAATLNEYFAHHFKGKLILRFDDTNPAKEKSEFEESIMADLQRLGIQHDILTHTSDHFDLIMDYANRMIREGKAYVDDLPVEVMRDNRMKCIESPNRANDVETNMRLWQEMIDGTEDGQKMCLRAKIDMHANNTCLRDPTIYRVVLKAHPRVGSKYKVYPSYDFACPIVDSIEGVTHALRTTEYHDRNAQYAWMLEQMGLRRVHIWDFSRLSFVFTPMSKRWLQWFVDHGIVESWADPRFPTVQGMIRRGMTIQALRQFMLEQGASKALTLQHWDKIWTINKKMIDPVCPRFVGINKHGAVPLTLVNGPDSVEYRVMPRHRKNPEVGEKSVAFYKELLMEQEDARVIAEGEEVTLMSWGNAVIDTITRSEDGTSVVSMQGHLHLEGDFRATKLKLTWLANLPEQLVPTVHVEFDHLLTKEKMEEGDKFEDYVNPDSRREVEVLGDPNLRTLPEGTILQLERRGYYYLDRPYLRPDRPVVLHLIPDGRQAKPKRA
eukprot:gnl/Trimastix_PCT/506.p2 GENE.gnl/Trimastix_PCT/506~~gnl/Trimastix_PCT/506.p2  ORF type:complete len:734 (-),score=291.67 gnl/Trimastix_PCT/506:135-2282(-)